METMSVRTEGAASAGAEVMDLSFTHELQCSRQWRGFLDAMKQEFAAALPAHELKRLMVRVGRRFAQAQPLERRETLQELQQEMNHIWSQCDWGRVQISQTVNGLTITHQYSPLSAAFSAADGEWTTGYLLGVYQHWFEAAGASDLRVELTSAADALGTARFRLVAD